MLSILIPTRNRPYQIEKLLESLRQASTHEAEIIIVYSGSDISGIVQKFEQDLTIKLIYSERKGQINQKLLGLKYINEDTDWVMFCDDDLLFTQSFFMHLASLKDIKSEIIGVGTSLPSTEKIPKSNSYKSKIARLFGLDNNGFGKLRVNGHANSYMNSEKIIETEWLSGASIWRSKFARMYSSVFTDSRYAAYEDVIFSFAMSKQGKLIFNPNLRLNFQNQDQIDVEPIDAFISSMCWRNYLVNSDSCFSPIKFLWAQIGRILFYLLSSKGRGFLRISRIYTEILISNFFKKNSIMILQKYC